VKTKSIKMFDKTILFFTIIYSANSYDLSCNKNEYFDPGVMSCQTCPTNASMVASPNGKFDIK
jgi:hypothetical protein